MRNVFTNTVAVLCLGLSPLLAASSAKLTSFPRPVTSHPATPNTASEGFIATAVLAGETDPEDIVPCFICVTGADIETIGFALPLAAVPEGAAITISVTGDDLFYGGDASFSYSIKANPSVAPVSTGSVSGTVSPSIWLAQFPITAPAAGHYILQGDIATGEGLSHHTTVTASLIVGAN
jgi:hypothetical protein